MKKLPFLLAFCCLNFLSNLNAQITQFWAGQDDSLWHCTSRLYIGCQVGSISDPNATFYVDWGDGQSESYTFGSTLTDTIYTISLTHAYSTTDTYAMQITCQSAVSGNLLDYGLDYTMRANAVNQCEMVQIKTLQQTPYDNFYNVPYDFTDINGITLTIYPFSWSSGDLYKGLNSMNAPYTVGINQTWLSNHQLIQVTPSTIITSFDQYSFGQILEDTFYVSCANGSPDPDFSFHYCNAYDFVAPLESGNLRMRILNSTCSNSSNVTVSIAIPATFIPDISNLNNAVLTNNTLTFDLYNVANFEDVFIPFTFPGTTPAGTSFCFYINLSNPNDLDQTNNFDSICDVVLNSYDPNDKSVDLPEQITPGQTEELTYIIHFQNDGNLNANDVVIQDTLSTNVDITTFKTLGSKHGVATSVNPTTRVVTFTFHNIDLAQSDVDLDGSQGFVVYSISEIAGLQEGTEIFNTAYIYFDFNPAIVTNTTHNINSTLSVDKQTLSNLGMFPNPAQDKLSFKGETVTSVSIYDLMGKLVLENNSVLNNEINLSTLQNGMYQVLVSTDKGVLNEKLVVKK